MLFAETTVNTSGVQALVVFMLFALPPVVIPPILARRRYLSPSRWLAMAGFAFFLAILCGVAIEAGVVTRTTNPTASDNLIRFGVLLLVVSFFGIGGCLLAAALSPKPVGQS